MPSYTDWNFYTYIPENNNVIYGTLPPWHSGVHATQTKEDLNPVRALGN